MPASYLDVPIFAGQGTEAVYSIRAHEQALHDATSPSGALLLSSCFDAFHQELSELSLPEIVLSRIDRADFGSPKDIISSLPHHSNNPIISNTKLFMFQSLRYLTHIESSNNSPSRFTDTLKANASHSLGVLGFSSGILVACVVAASHNTLAYISFSVEAFRLAFWIGVRTQDYRKSVLGGGEECLPWSVVLLGTDRKETDAAIEAFQHKNTQASSLSITVVTDDRRLTVSGHPIHLEAFSSTLPTNITIHKTNLNTLYHSPSQLASVRKQVLKDIKYRAIKFPEVSELIAPIRSTNTGELFDRRSASGLLVEAVVDMLLVQPVNWDRVVSSLAKALPTSSDVEFDNPPCIRLLNFGPGTGLMRSMEKSCKLSDRVSVDLTFDAARLGRRNPKQEPIAIVGMAVNMPGAPNTTKLWEVLEKGINTCSEIPESRFKVTDYTNPSNPKSTRTLKARTGNFISTASSFDHSFFNISPREARSMDPQQRVLLHTTYEALENAGYVPDATPSFRREGIGCWVGAATRDYVQNLRNEVDVYYSTGTLAAFLSGRISYAMQLGGPSITVDTACSSSLVAIYQACRALGDRDCSAAIAGGVNIISSPDMMIGLDRGHFLSPTGQCKAFDASADGYSRSEGCGMFVLKRLSDAITENDNILGIIRGVEVNQSGLAHSITHPHAPTQTALFNRLLENAGIDSTRINVVEAHGTGTQAGDPCELESIRSISAASRTVQNPLYVTSIKANIGHLEAASGAAGLAKLLLMLRYRTIPRQILLENLNPNIAPLESDHTIISTVQGPWMPSQEGQTRVALLNNFGAAGSNAALILEEFANVRPRISPPTDLSFVFGLSAKTESSLSVLRSRYLAWLQSPEIENIKLCDIAYTATSRRQLYPHRIAVTAKSKQELTDKLGKASALHVTEHSGKVVFVFSGQGSHYLGMGASLYHAFPIFKQNIDECHSYLISSGFPGVLQIITADTVVESDLAQSSTIEAYQTATFALEYALMKLWISWGIKPTAVVGHSLGEFAALVLAEVITLKSALSIIANRAFLVARNCTLHTSGMLAVGLGHSVVADILASSSIFSNLMIACYNSAIQSVVSGPTNELDMLKRHLDNHHHCKSVNLAVPFAYHSPAMQPVLDDLLVIANKHSFLPPTMPVLSSVYGRVILPGDGSVFNAHYIARQCAEPVLFDQAISASLLIPDFANAAAWIELGPEVTCLSMIKSNQGSPSHLLLLGTLRKRQDVWTTLSESLAQLYLSSVDVLWRKPFVHVSFELCSELPSYPFTSAEFWVDFKEEGPGLSSYLPELECHPSHLILEYSLLRSWSQFPSDANGRVAIFETPIKGLAGFIRAHTVGGFHLCPASVYLEQVLAGIYLAKGHLAVTFLNDRVILRNIEFIKPLVYIEQVSRTVKTSITFELDGSGTFTISSKIGGGDEDLVHVHGCFRHKSNKQIEMKLSRCLPFVRRQMAVVMRPINGTPPETFLARTIYEIIFPRVVDYGVAYRTIQSLTVDVNGMEGSAVIKLPIDNDGKPKFVAHPAFMDSLFHVAGFIANMKGDQNVVYICNAVGSMRIIPDLVDETASYAIYCCNIWLPEEEIMLADTYALQLTGPQRIVAHLKGLQFRRVQFDNFKRGLSLAASSVASPLYPNSAESSIYTCTTTSPALPAQRPFASDTQNQVLSTEVMQIVSQTCNIDSTAFDVHTDLASLGVDSLLSIEIFDKLRQVFPYTRLDPQALAFCHTIAEIIEELYPTHSPDLGGLSSSSTSVADLVIDEAKVMLGSRPVVCTDDIADQMDTLSLVPLKSTETIYSVKDSLTHDIPHSRFTTHTTAGERRSFISGLEDTSKTAPVCAAVGAKTLPPHIDPESIVKAFRLGEVPVLIQKSSAAGHVPLFLIHDGSGLISYYDRLSPLGRDVWGIHNPHFVNEVPWPWDSLVSMAIEYASYVLKVTSDSVLIGGWSFGGVVAFEIARQLLKQGTDARVILIDSPSPVNHVSLPESLLDSVINLDAHSSCSGIRRFVKAQFRLNSRVLGEYNPLPSDGPFPSLVLLRSREGFQAPGISDIPTWLGDRSDGLQVVVGWESLVGCSVSVRDIPGHHFQPFQPSHIEEVSCQISKGCMYLESL